MPDDEAPGQPLSRRQKFRAVARRWLLWTLLRVFLIAGIGAGVGTARHYATPRLLMNARRLVSLNGYSNYQWFSEQEILLFKEPHNDVEVCSLNASKKTINLLYTRPAAWSTNCDSSVGKDNYVFRDGYLLIEGYDRSSDPNTLVQKGDIPSPFHSGKIAITGKPKFTRMRAAFSPDGKKVACVCWLERPNMWMSLRHRVQPSFRVRTTTYASVYISDLNGKNTRELGSISAVPEKNSPYWQSEAKPYSLTEVHWFSDSKHLAFAYGDGLYVIPAP